MISDAMTHLQWFKTENRDGKTMVFDPLRKKYCTLTPEEEVRQKVLYLLVEHLGFSPGLLAVEYSIKVNGLDKRCDVVAFGKDGTPMMIVECKASTVKLSQAALDQAIRYYSALHPQYLLLYNGMDCYCFKMENGALNAMDHIPMFSEL